MILRVRDRIMATRPHGTWVKTCREASSSCMTCQAPGAIQTADARPTATYKRTTATAVTLAKPRRNVAIRCQVLAVRFLASM